MSAFRHRLVLKDRLEQRKGGRLIEMRRGFGRPHRNIDGVSLPPGDADAHQPVCTQESGRLGIHGQQGGGPHGRDCLLKSGDGGHALVSRTRSLYGRGFPGRDLRIPVPLRIRVHGPHPLPLPHRDSGGWPSTAFGWRCDPERLREAVHILLEPVEPEFLEERDHPFKVGRADRRGVHGEIEFPIPLERDKELRKVALGREPADFHRGSEGLQVLPALPLDLLDVRVDAFKRAVFLKELRGGLRPDPVRTRDVV